MVITTKMAASDCVVTLPPRPSRSVEAVTILRNRSSLDVLKQMGFSKDKAEKALVATGDKGVQLALDWLLSHVNDPELESGTERDYFLYLCPLAEQLEQLERFWSDSYSDTGFNRAHNSFPHITLCASFKVKNSSVTKLCHILKTVSEKHVSSLGPVVPLEYFSSSNFLGLFVNEAFMPRLKQVTAEFAEEAQKIGVQMEPHRKQLHVSLAYQFVSTAKQQLETLAAKIDLNATGSWEIRLYSRHPQIANKPMRRVCYPHRARDSEELELAVGDLLSVSQPPADSGAAYSWLLGVSHLTGCSGLFPSNYTRPAIESDAWTLHRTIPLIVPDSEVAADDARNGDVANGGVPTPSGVHDYSNPTYMPTACIAGGSPAPRRAAPTPEPTREPSPSHKATCLSEQTLNRLLATTGTHADHRAAAPFCGRQLYIVRHGERIDFTFGKDWIHSCFDHAGKYIRTDLNMPKELPRRKGGRHCFLKDAPLTVLGHQQAKVLGEALAEKQVQLTHVYSSPSVRCVQTGAEILQMLGSSAKINVEPGLFEWFGWYKHGMPSFMTTAELVDSGFNINTAYDAILPQSDFDLQETIDDYYDRSHRVAKEILRRHENEGGSVLLLGHAASLDTCTRQLVGRPPPADFIERVRSVPYCAVIVAQETSTGGGGSSGGGGTATAWQLVEPPTLPFTHTANTRYDCAFLMHETLMSM